MPTTLEVLARQDECLEYTNRGMFIAMFLLREELQERPRPSVLEEAAHAIVNREFMDGLRNSGNIGQVRGMSSWRELNLLGEKYKAPADTQHLLEGSDLAATIAQAALEIDASVPEGKNATQALEEFRLFISAVQIAASPANNSVENQTHWLAAA